MSTTFSLHSLKLSSPFLHGLTSLTHLSKPNSSASHQLLRAPDFPPPIRAMKTLQGRVVCSTNDKTVSVEVVRLAPHPKYKRRVRKKKKFQAHDADNQFKVGDYVQLEKSRPISNTKTFIAVPVPSRNGKQEKEEKGQLGLPLESNQPQEQQA
ncbi:hypothetical protein V6N13_144256 [Hibiscus sabdariffa]|uniref:Small ribosomal subunit protein uS17c n=1 Tax=Hibiscus sabdariffa TaxID=183260 RepID=A0ABR2FJU4_9ROSI